MSAAFHPPSSPALAAGLRAEWRRVARVLADPAIELDSVTVTPLLAVHRRLIAAGVSIDPMADALVRQLGWQLADAEAFADG